MRIVGRVLLTAGVALLVFCGTGFSLTAVGAQRERFEPWRAEAGYSRESRLGMTGGAVLLVAGICLEREAAKKGKGTM